MRSFFRLRDSKMYRIIVGFSTLLHRESRSLLFNLSMQGNWMHRFSSCIKILRISLLQRPAQDDRTIGLLSLYIRSAKYLLLSATILRMFCLLSFIYFLLMLTTPRSNRLVNTSSKIFSDSLVFNILYILGIKALSA